ncbi:hypothetical protein ATANTOWER_029525 [Ataeniobius toweri]|uniref:Uncharacterized protein n=1 Tax=Ataeniobius toweri TaxID=208326 RepID=A0ABU7C4P7_9TELE|nr:hypothetical protein [Ataeniobius toweri]
MVTLEELQRSTAQAKEKRDSLQKQDHRHKPGEPPEPRGAGMDQLIDFLECCCPRSSCTHGIRSGRTCSYRVTANNDLTMSFIN